MNGRVVMSFRLNGVPANSLENLALTSREKRALRNSWAGVFADDLFPAIDERPFEVLYSREPSRPNTPVNVLVGALIIKEMFGFTDDEILEAVLLDPRVQYALHTTQFEEQPLSDKSLQRFRRRCAEHEVVTGEDLLGDCIRDLGKQIAKLMGLAGTRKRMDSMMVASNIRRLSRTELLYTCTANVLRADEKAGAKVPVGMEHYLDPADYNRQFYHAQKEEREEILASILDDAERILAMPDEHQEQTKEYQLLRRCFEEQTTLDEKTGKRRLRTSKEGMHSGILQNPADPDATYRVKAGREYRGYALNIEETCGKNGSVITDYDLRQNTFSDSKFLKESLARNGRQPEGTRLVTDGAYSGLENTLLAKEQNVTLITTDMTGREVNPILAEFKFNKTHDIVLSCPAGNRPWKSGRPHEDGRIHVTFRPDVCASCPHKDECGIKFSKRTAYVDITWGSCMRARQARTHKTAKFRQYANLRNGAEASISTLRNKHDVDHMPVRGLGRIRTFIAGKIGAFNFTKLLRHRRSQGRYAPNPVLAGC